MLSCSLTEMQLAKKIIHKAYKLKAHTIMKMNMHTSAAYDRHSYLTMLSVTTSDYICRGIIVCVLNSKWNEESIEVALSNWKLFSVIF